MITCKRFLEAKVFPTQLPYHHKKRLNSSSTANKKRGRFSKSFLGKYQTFTGDDLSEMVNTLSNADATKNMTASSGNTKLQISSQTLDPQTVDTIFRWTNTINGADYTDSGVISETVTFTL